MKCSICDNLLDSRPDPWYDDVCLECEGAILAALDQESESEPSSIEQFTTSNS